MRVRVASVALEDLVRQNHDLVAGTVTAIEQLVDRG